MRLFDCFGRSKEGYQDLHITFLCGKIEYLNPKKVISFKMNPRDHFLFKMAYYNYVNESDLNDYVKETYGNSAFFSNSKLVQYPKKQNIKIDGTSYSIMSLYDITDDLEAFVDKRNMEKYVDRTRKF